MCMHMHMYMCMHMHMSMHMCMSCMTRVRRGWKESHASCRSHELPIPSNVIVFLLAAATVFLLAVARRHRVFLLAAATGFFLVATTDVADFDAADYHFRVDLQVVELNDE